LEQNVLNSWFIKLSWSEAKEIMGLLGFFLAVIAALWALYRLPKIAQLLIEFQRAKTPIWDLRTAVTDLQSLEPFIKEQLAALRTSIHEAKLQLSELQEQVDQNREIDDIKVIQNVVEPTKIRDIQDGEPIERVGKKWKEFLEVLRAKLPDADMRQVGQAAGRLMDRRRNNAITEDDAKLIAALASQYKRFARLKSFPPDELAQFLAGVEQSIQKVELVGQRTAT
jgi:hypothetical protein